MRPLTVRFDVENPWFSSAAKVATFSKENMLSTKLHALLQLDKGRDLFNLAHELKMFENQDVARVVR